MILKNKPHYMYFASLLSLILSSGGSRGAWGARPPQKIPEFHKIIFFCVNCESTSLLAYVNWLNHKEGPAFTMLYLSNNFALKILGPHPLSAPHVFSSRSAPHFKPNLYYTSCRACIMTMQNSYANHWQVEMVPNLYIMLKVHATGYCYKHM